MLSGHRIRSRPEWEFYCRVNDLQFVINNQHIKNPEESEEIDSAIAAGNMLKLVLDASSPLVSLSVRGQLCE